jgi:hypothetical protein
VERWKVLKIRPSTIFKELKKNVSCHFQSPPLVKFPFKTTNEPSVHGRSQFDFPKPSAFARFKPFLASSWVFGGPSFGLLSLDQYTLKPTKRLRKIPLPYTYFPLLPSKILALGLLSFQRLSNLENGEVYTTMKVSHRRFKWNGRLWFIFDRTSVHLCNDTQSSQDVNN